MEILTGLAGNSLRNSLPWPAQRTLAGIENQRCWWYVAGIRQRYV